MTNAKFFSILSLLVAKGFNTNGAKAEVATYIAGNTDLAVIVESVDGKFKRVTFHRETKAASDLCEKMNKWIVRFNMQQVEEVVEVETVEVIETETPTVEAVTPAPIFPVSVLVHWSESAEFKGEKVTYTFEEFERKAMNAASLAGSGMVTTRPKSPLAFTLVLNTVVV
jgi:hypothetical protein